MDSSGRTTASAQLVLFLVARSSRNVRAAVVITRVQFISLSELSKSVNCASRSFEYVMFVMLFIS